MREYNGVKYRIVKHPIFKSFKCLELDGVLYDLGDGWDDNILAKEYIRTHVLRQFEPYELQNLEQCLNRYELERVEVWI